jgi:hypothetical protein
VFPVGKISASTLTKRLFSEDKKTVYVAAGCKVSAYAAKTKISKIKNTQAIFFIWISSPNSLRRN